MSAIKVKIRSKPVFRSSNKRLAAYSIVGFINQKQKVKVCIGGNQVTQTQNQSLFSNTNLRLSKPNAILVLSNRLISLIVKCFNCDDIDHYSQNYPKPDHKKLQSLENTKG